MLALLGGFLLWFSQLGSDTRMLLTVFVVAAAVVLFALGLTADARLKKRFLALTEAVQGIAKGNHNTKAPEGETELGAVGEAVNTLATQLSSARYLVKQRELQLSKLNENSKSSKHKSLFLANLSRQLQITFDHVVGLCEMLSDTELQEEQQCITDHIQKACATLVDTLGKLSDFEDLELGSVTIADNDFELLGAIKAVVANLAFRAEKKGLRLQGNIHRTVPERCSGDEKRFKQVLFNFIENAINHTEDGEITIGVSVDEDAPSHVVLRVDVSDTGSGMSSKRADKVFRNPLAQQPKAGDEPARVGLGLAICRDLVEMMGGRVGVRTKKGHGSTFWFTVCLQKRAAAPRQRVINPELEMPDEAGLPILVVTPKPENAAQIFVALQKAGFRVNVALSRVQFLDAIKHEVYGAVVVDGERPELIATVANWTKAEGAEQIPVIGLPYMSTGGGDREVDVAQLQESLRPLLNTKVDTKAAVNGA